MTSRELTSGFDFWSCGHLRMVVMHLPVKFGAHIFIQCGVIDILPKLKMAAAAIFDLLRGAMEQPTKAHSWCVVHVKRVWNFCRSGLKVLFTPPKFEFFGSLKGTSFRPPKGTSLHDFTSFELSRVKIHPRVWPVRVPEKKKVLIKNNFLLYFTHLPRSPQWVGLYQIWYTGSPRGRNQVCRIFCWLVQGYWFCRGLKFACTYRN